MFAKRAALCAAIAALTATAVAACGGPSSTPTSTSGSGGTSAIAIGLQFATVNFNPWLVPNGPNYSLNYTSAVYDSLTTLTGPDKVGPGIATSWTEPNPTTLEMTLRPGIAFADGTSLDAAAVKANFDYARTASPAGSLVTYIKNLTTTVVNATTVRFTSTVPVTDLPFDFATGAGFIVSPKALAHPSSLNDQPDGSGPYTLDASGTISGQQYTFTRRATYWNKAAFPYGKVTLRVYSSQQALDSAVRSGQVQVAQGAAQTNAADKAAGLTVVPAPQITTAGIWINDEAGAAVKPLGDVRVRQALNYAVDRKAIAALGFGADGTATSLVVGPDSPGYRANAAASYPYDPAKAKALLAQAGYPDGFTLPMLSTQSGDLLAQAVAGYLRAIGVTVQISDHNTDFVQQATSGRWASMVFEWSMDPAAQSIASLVSANFGPHTPQQDAQIQALAAQVLGTTGTAQSTAIDQAVATINQQAWFVMVGTVGLTYSTANTVSCTDLGLATCLLSSLHPAK
ncbi:ABC transporter substrate-binding protein [Streptacidiphilus cavernicola]|uniref:ABC transporter substrate-binding protein n=1 Tax=Streptacidiphilus cavernicola TaxID=3342716 RepID=A0ABV6W5E1_9ACTN